MYLEINVHSLHQRTILFHKTKQNKQQQTKQTLLYSQ